MTDKGRIKLGKISGMKTGTERLMEDAKKADTPEQAEKLMRENQARWLNENRKNRGRKQN